MILSCSVHGVLADRLALLLRLSDVDVGGRIHDDNDNVVRSSVASRSGRVRWLWLSVWKCCSVFRCSNTPSFDAFWWILETLSFLMIILINDYRYFWFHSVQIRDIPAFPAPLPEENAARRPILYATVLWKASVVNSDGQVGLEILDSGLFLCDSVDYPVLWERKGERERERRRRERRRREREHLLAKSNPLFSVPGG